MKAIRIQVRNQLLNDESLAQVHQRNDPLERLPLHE
jgi:hypothetical protein